MTGTTEKELKTSKWLATFPCYQTDLGKEWNAVVFYDGKKLKGFSEVEMDDCFAGYQDFVPNFEDIQYNIVEGNLVFYEGKCKTCGKEMTFDEFVEGQGNECGGCFERRYYQSYSSEDE